MPWYGRCFPFRTPRSCGAKRSIAGRPLRTHIGAVPNRKANSSELESTRKMTKTFRSLLVLIGALLFVVGLLLGQQIRRSKFEKYLRPAAIVPMRGNRRLEDFLWTRPRLRFAGQLGIGEALANDLPYQKT